MRRKEEGKSETREIISQILLSYSREDWDKRERRGRERLDRELRK